MPRGAIQLSINLSRQPSDGRPMPPTWMTIQRKTIKAKTQATPPHPKGLSSPQDRSAASRGNNTVMANWAN